MALQLFILTLVTLPAARSTILQTMVRVKPATDFTYMRKSCTAPNYLATLHCTLITGAILYACFICVRVFLCGFLRALLRPVRLSTLGYLEFISLTPVTCASCRLSRVNLFKTCNLRQQQVISSLSH